MSEMIHPEAGMPTSTQAFELSDRNPQVTLLGGEEADGGPMALPQAAESRVTQVGAARPVSAGVDS